MITAFPAPYPGELLYGTIARYQRLFGFPAARSTAVTLFGSRSATAVVDLPLAVGRLAARLPPGSPVTATDLVGSHTHFGYFAPFLDAARAERARGEMEGATLSRGRFIVGLARSHVGVRSPEHLLYCRDCVAEDRRAVGEAYWRREHQLPGVFLCPAHGAALRRGPPRRRDLRQVFVYHDLETWVRAGGGPPLAPPDAPAGVLRRLAEQSAALFAAPAGTAVPGAIARHHRRLLVGAGAAAPHARERVRYDRAHALLTRTLGAALLDAVLTGRAACEERWLRTLLWSGTRSVFHPLKHLLVLAATGTPVDSFLADATAAGRHAGRRPLHPARAVDRRKQVVTVDADRDAAALAEAMRAVCELLLSPDRPERITAAAVARRTSYRVLIQAPGGRIPRTTAYLQSVVEDLPGVRRRRLAWVAGRYAAERVVPYRFQLFERAGLIRRDNRALDDAADEHVAWITRLVGTPGRLHDDDCAAN